MHEQALQSRGKDISMLARTRRKLGIRCLAQDNPFIGFEMTISDIKAIEEKLKTAKPFVTEDEYTRERRKLYREKSLIFSEASEYLKKLLNEPDRFLREAGNNRWVLRHYKKAIDAVILYQGKDKTGANNLANTNAIPLLKHAARHVLDMQIRRIKNADNKKDFEYLLKDLRDILTELKTELSIAPTNEQRKQIKESKFKKFTAG